ncbi:MAG: hypothetical protein IPK54_10265 [Dokdonella sp.]|uniref:hypothetical protein n=1 Tax=Dokdonella sp. TaxID=2291710 RepID=UPI0025BBA033|nr:hypothetical protein [Dokdonella sp.]MBK8123916.1 hypothetical protein [Dokdonella sp.]
MAYTPPALTDPVVLSPGYTPPALTDPVVLGATVVVVDGTLAVTIPPPTPPVSFSARQRPNLGANSLYVERLYRPAPPDFAATGTKVQPATLALTVLPPILPATFRARERINAVSIAVTIQPPTLQVSLAAQVETIQPVAVTMTIPPPSLLVSWSASITLDIALPDADGTGVSIESQPAAKTTTGLTMAQQQMQPARRGVGIAEQPAAPIQVGAELLAAHGLRVRQGVGLPQAHGLPRWGGAGIDHAEAIRVRRGVELPQAHGLPLDAGTRAPHTDTIRTRNPLAMGQQAALPTALPLTLGQHQAQVTANRLSIRWQQAKWPDPGRWWPRYVVPPLTAPVVLIPGYTPRPLACPIVLSWNNVAQPPCGGGEEPQPGIVVPVREVYVVLNTFSLVRADTAEPVIAIDFDAAIDADSWTWTWSATVPGSQMDLVRSPALGEFVELIATLNGTAIRCVVERLGRSRQFGKSAIKISGRGRAAALADPSSPTISVMNTESRTAQQLLDDALTLNGVPLGWTVDWQLEDWPVPAGAWSYTGTYIGAATRIAEAGGGYVQADKSEEILHILPYYPIAPWEWATATPDIVLPEDVCTTEDIEWSDKAAYNAAWIVGGAGGRREHIKRAGSAADRHAPTVVDSLATDPIMTRQRGLRVLADTGRQALIGIKLPVLEETGIILPGNLIEYSEQGQTHIGLSRSVSLRWEFPKCRQTVRIETHELESV